MLFNSIEFLFFFPIVVALFFLTPHKYRWMLLLAASYYFYACWKAEYLILIVVSTLVDYLIAIGMSKTKSISLKKVFLTISIITNLGILFFFKYFSFFNENVRGSLNAFNIFYEMPVYEFLLPVGISFYTFQTLSYSIDVYRGVIKPERHLGIFALFVSFWPQLVAGPIERSGNLLPQFKRKSLFDYNRMRSGLLLMLWGFFKKVVLADRLAVIVNEVYNNPSQYEGSSLWIATYCFAFQIYCDFSAYSDIAIGAARLMGFDLMENFKRPYFSKSISEFWSRWHISLSTWFRDYLYIPLGGNRVIKWRWYLNLFIVFLVSGLWHGANWTFVIWGALHGLYLVVGLFTFRIQKKLFGSSLLLHTVATFHLVVFAWIFFRANSMDDAFLIIYKSFEGLNFEIFKNDPESWINYIVILLGLFMLLAKEWLDRNDNFFQLIVAQNISLRWSIYMGLILFILFFGFFRNPGSFIYFQF